MRLLLAGAVIAVVTSCLVDRKSKNFECSRTEDCDAGRVCDTGFCVELECPSECNAGCDPIAMTCNISCGNSGGGGGASCGFVDCPTGYRCTIACTSTNACSDIDCTDAASCSITCSANNACGDIDCGDGECDVFCNATNACDLVDCSTSCACDVTCNTGSCLGMTCPMSSTIECTVDGTPATACSSTAQTGCSSC